MVHFAVSNREVEMTTRLEGPATRFLPFNRGDHGGKGNPSDGAGHPTAYLWEEVWQRDSWLEILGRYMVTRRDPKKLINSVIFPRYHQLDGTRKLAAEVLNEGPGGRFLIQHSAGSGKTNSIAWSAHFLSELHDADDNKLFSSVNDLFEGDLTDDDKLVYVNDVIKGKLMESEELATQARNNTKAQFANSPTLRDEMMNAIMDALAAHQAMSKQALDSQRVRDDMKDVLLGPGQLYEALRDRGDH